MGTLSVGTKHREGEKGFTLIELLVVVTIIGILAAIVSVSVGGFTGKASVQAHKSTLNGVQAAVDAYIADHFDGTGAPVAPTTAQTAAGAGLTTFAAGAQTSWYDTNGLLAASAAAVVYQTVAFDVLTKSATTVVANTTRTQGPYLRLGGNVSLACVFKNNADAATGTADVNKAYMILLCTDTGTTQ